MIVKRNSHENTPTTYHASSRSVKHTRNNEKPNELIMLIQWLSTQIQSNQERDIGIIKTKKKKKN